jgi:hypothetical protein
MRVDQGEPQPVPLCDRDSCRAAGLSFALLELCQYWDDRDRADYRICVAEIDAHMQKLDATLPAALKRASSKLLQQMREQRSAWLAHATAGERSGNHEGASEIRQAQANADRLLRAHRNRLILGRWLGKALVGVAILANALHRSVAGELSPHRPVPSKVGAGRPKASLLSAVLQRLEHGGLERREMMEIVAGLAGRGASVAPAAVKDQIRQRLRSDDCSTIGPFQESEGLRPGKRGGADLEDTGIADDVRG